MVTQVAIYIINVTFELNDYAEDGKIELRFTQSRIRRNLCKPLNRSDFTSDQSRPMSISNKDRRRNGTGFLLAVTAVKIRKNQEQHPNSIKMVRWTAFQQCTNEYCTTGELVYLKVGCNGREFGLVYGRRGMGSQYR